MVDANVPDGAGLCLDDPYLSPYADQLRARYARYKMVVEDIEEKEGGLESFSRGYEMFGFRRCQRDGRSGLLYVEWAPAAKDAALFGDFNGWNRDTHRMQRGDFGRWSIFIPDKEDGTRVIPHGSKLKVTFYTGSEWIDRLPPWIPRVVQEKDNPIFDSVHWMPESPYEWRHPRLLKTRLDDPDGKCPESVRIYEAHVGMASEELKVASYREFADNIIPYIAELGYDTIQLMGVMEHAYYASFGYQVTSFFAVSSRCGTPEDLKYLVDEAHARGIRVLLDLVHSHASKNVLDGLNMFDGTDHCYFHGGERGNHPVWDSRLFNYDHWEVLRFLLSNLRWWIEEYHFDGFRFDGVTSMLFTHHGIGTGFEKGYEEYYGDGVDYGAVTYLTVANAMLHALYPGVVTIAEDVSGMPGLCRPVDDGGFGFDFRLGMGIPDMWVEHFKSLRDEQWDMGHLVHTLTNRRHKERTIAYVESHDQALVGDKTAAFWLMDKAMYTDMSVLHQLTPEVDRGIALHKMIRLITCALGGEGYLTFMGNEFGHPEWIDFPRAGNGDSYQYARRQWSLARDPLLRYQHMLAFDRAMMHLERSSPWLASPQAYVSLKHEGDKVIVFERGSLVFAFNFHTSSSFSDYPIACERPGKYRVVLDSDRQEFGGHQRVSSEGEYFTKPEPMHSRQHHFLAYLPNRCALVFALADQ